MAQSSSPGSCVKYVTFMLLSLLLPTTDPHAAAQSFETPPVLDARDVLPKGLRKGPDFTVDSAVVNDGYMNHYLVRSDYGTYRVVGTFLLGKLVADFSAIARLRKERSDQVALESGKKAATEIVMAPINSAEKLIENVSDTDKLTDMVQSAPRGVWNLFRSAAGVVQSGATAVYEQGRSLAGGTPREKGGKSLTDKAVDATLDFIGYNKRIREVAKSVQVDPYTQNEALRSELRRVASIQTSVNIAKRFVPGIGGIPYAGTINKYYKLAEQAAAYEDPDKIRELNEKILRSLGQKDSTAAKLVKNPHYTPFVEAILVNQLKRLAGVKNLDTLIDMASNAESQAAAGFFLSATTMLADYHSENRLAEFVSGVQLPAAVTTKRRLFVPLPVDYLAWTRDVSTLFTDLERRLNRETKVISSEVRISGNLSPLARKNFTARGVDRIIQNVGY